MKKNTTKISKKLRVVEVDNLAGCLYPLVDKSKLKVPWKKVEAETQRLAAIYLAKKDGLKPK